MSLSFGFVVRSLKHRNYRLFFAGQLISLMGTWITTIATSWLMYRLTGSAFLLASLNALAMLPSLFISPLVGVQLDRWNKNKVLIVTQTASMLQSAALAVLTLSGIISVNQLFALVIFQGIINSFDMPARQAFLREVVPLKEDLSNAIALNSALFNGSRLIGPAIGGLIISLANEGFCFLIDAFSYAAVLIALFLIQPEKKQALAKSNKSVFKDFKEGIAYSIKVSPIGILILFVAVVSFSITPYIVLLPPIAKDIFKGDSSTLGLLMASSGCGALLSSLYLASRNSILGLGKIMTASGFILSTALIVFAQVTRIWIAFPTLFFIGLSMVLLTASANTLLQSLCDPTKLGRIMSFFTMAFSGVIPIGSLFAGWSAEYLGIPTTLSICGIIILTGTSILALQLPALRNKARPILIERGIIPAATVDQLGVGWRV